MCFADIYITLHLQIISANNEGSILINGNGNENGNWSVGGLVGWWPFALS
jgi:hypothetical protein